MKLPTRHYCEKHDCYYEGKVCVACQAAGYSLCVRAGRIPKPKHFAGEGQRDIDPDPETIRLRAAMVKAMGLCGTRDAQKLAKKLAEEN